MATTLPTRVSRACDRCRRNKSRCDTYRPCSLCVRAGLQCPGGSGTSSYSATPQPRGAIPRSHSDQTWTNTPPHSSKRKRQSELQPENHITPSSGHLSGPPLRQNTPSAVAPSSTASDRHVSHPPDDDCGDSAINIAKNIYRLDSRQMVEASLSAIPGAAGSPPSVFGSGRHARTRRNPTSSYLTHALPSDDEIAVLILEYFETTHWFSLVILEPKFRLALDAIKDGFAEPSDEPFLFLLSTILGLAAWYVSHKQEDVLGCGPQYWRIWSGKLIDNAERQITKLLDQNSIVAIQTLTLLGSFYVYHGRPSLSFSLLGATIKSAQAAGLHQETIRMSEMDTEERKRLWWTIYTWDRFASITYGRPLGINDKDCNVAMPGNVEEERMDLRSTADVREQSVRICYSAYQRSLNELYLIASPAIESLYSARGSENPQAAEEYVVLLQRVTTDLWQWRRSLSDELFMNLDQDSPMQQKPAQRAQRLQALSLHLTFESLMIILHRPFLKQQLQVMRGGLATSPSFSRVESIDARSPDAGPSSVRSSFPETLGPEQWWDAAVRTARVTELPNLTEIATDTHLVSFMALNLFNAAIVMVVLALSDPLNDRAQQAKRAIGRVYRLQTMLGTRSTLSKQSSQVLNNLIELLLRREREVLLEPIPQTDSGRHGDESRSGTASTTQSSVQQVLGVSEDRNANPYTMNADLATRLDSSLASVQKVFATGPQSSRDPSLQRRGLNGHDDPWAQGQAAQTLSTDHGDLGVPSEYTSALHSSNEWNSLDFSIGEGVGWFWDPAWDDIEI